MDQAGNGASSVVGGPSQPPRGTLQRISSVIVRLVLVVTLTMLGMWAAGKVVRTIVPLPSSEVEDVSSR